jgi:hypothetical protein
MLLDRAGVVETDPFPHLVIENALPNDYYERLLETSKLHRTRSLEAGK